MSQFQIYKAIKNSGRKLSCKEISALLKKEKVWIINRCLKKLEQYGFLEVEVLKEHSKKIYWVKEENKND